MAISLTVNLVPSEDGSIDQEASVVAFRGALARRIAERETEETQIANAVSELFDQYKGAAIGMPAVASMTCAKLNAEPANHKILSERILNYVRENAQGKTAEDGTVERPSSLFVIAKGRDGGCKRRSDIVEKPAKQ